jgi:FkbM family methyltransferase
MSLTMGNAIKAAFGFFGLEVSRKSNFSVSKPTGGHPENVALQLGKYTLLAPSESSLCRIYAMYPESNQAIGRLAQCVATAYPNMRFVDVGANIGDTVAIVRNKVNVPALCLEGDNKSFALLTENIKQFSGNVVAKKIYMGEIEERIRVNLLKEGWNTTIIPAHDDNCQQELSLTTLDRLLESDTEMKNSRFVKVDTEGYDIKILHGAVNFLQQVQPVLFFEYNRENMSAIGENGLRVFDLLRKCDYDRLMFWDPTGRFLLSTNISNRSLISHLHEYADGFRSSNHYYDICAFSANDVSIAEKCEEIERAHRERQSGPVPES